MGSATVHRRSSYLCLSSSRPRSYLSPFAYDSKSSSRVETLRLNGNGTFAFEGGVVWRGGGGSGGESSTSPSSGEDGAYRLFGLPSSGVADAARFGGVEYILPLGRKPEGRMKAALRPRWFPYVMCIVSLRNPPRHLPHVQRVSVVTLADPTPRATHTISEHLQSSRLTWRLLTISFSSGTCLPMLKIWISPYEDAVRREHPGSQHARKSNYVRCLR